MLIPLFSKDYDISVGSGYRFGLHYAVDYLTGFHQQIIVPVSYYYNLNDFFSIGVRNKIGYGFTFFDTNKEITQVNANISIKFDTFPTEHEIYNNISFMMKLGKNVKFAAGIGCTFKYCFLNIPDSTFIISVNVNDPDFNFILLDPNIYDYFSIGPSIDFNMEVLNRDKSFSFMLGTPFEFLIPINKVKRINIESVNQGGYLFLKSRHIDTFYLNFLFGLEFIFCFNFHHDL